MDAFAVAIATGVTLRRVTLRQNLRLSWHFGLFQGLMPILGWSLGLTVQELIAAVDHWIAFGLLTVLGGRMIIGTLRCGTREFRESDPTKGWSLVMLSIATSIDALAVGLSLAMLQVEIWG
ncbi:manganese efflux pump, partial [bacterium]|nr:manganese efflux pump [candidate division CSSED10-310 bacterium]